MSHAIRLAALLGATLAAGPALAQDRLDWHGGGRGDARAYRLEGPGVPMLVPELRDTPRGHAFVLRNFDFDHDGVITPPEARAANRAFLQAAGPRRDHFDWDARDGGLDRGYGPDRGPDRARDGGPERVVVEEVAPLPPAFRAWHPRQTRLGATIDFGDVLFETDSAALRPGARDRIAGLADFLRRHPRVRIEVDGYTDSRASREHNQQLSQARAGSVAAALSRAGVDSGRLRTIGHGEDDPVASNATPQGRQQNRRVEVTLLGQRADRFGN